MDLKKFNRDQIEVSELIGEGASGRVYKALIKTNPENLIAIKRISAKSTDSLNIINQLRILSQLNCQNLVATIGYIRDNKGTDILMEFCSKGTLEALIKNSQNQKISIK